jgi:hypothetical protein
MAKLFRIRKPRLRVSKRGKVSLSGGGLSIGGKAGRVNISKSGVSTSFGGKHLRYNSRRGMNCGFIALLVLGATGTAIGAVGVTLFSVMS